VDRLGGVTYEQLLDGYLNRDAPLIVVDAMESWPVMNTDDFWFDNITQVSCCNIFNDITANLINKYTLNSMLLQWFSKLFTAAESFW
jgi:hypothetical protein